MDSIRSFLADGEVSSSTALFLAILRWGHVLLSDSGSRPLDADSSGVTEFSVFLGWARLVCAPDPQLRFSKRSRRSALSSGTRLCGLVNRRRWWISRDVQIFRQYLTVCRAVLADSSKFLVNHIICNPLSDCCHPQLFLRHFGQLMSVSDPHILRTRTHSQHNCSAMPASVSRTHSPTCALSPERNLISNFELSPGTRSCHQSCHPGFPPSVLPDESGRHVHRDDRVQASSQQPHLLQEPEHQTTAPGLDQTHADMD